MEFLWQFQLQYQQLVQYCFALSGYFIGVVRNVVVSLTQAPKEVNSASF